VLLRWLRALPTPLLPPVCALGLDALADDLGAGGGMGSVLRADLVERCRRVLTDTVRVL
jgi:hypothetical protein